jgi:hypothetical protein
VRSIGEQSHPISSETDEPEFIAAEVVNDERLAEA